MTRNELTALRERVEWLEQRVTRLTDTIGLTLAGDGRRLEELAARAGRLSAAADAALLGLQERAAAAGVGLARTRPDFGVVHRAEATGYVSLYFTGGRTDTVRLLAGWEDPPTECVCEANTRNGLNSYAGGIVRKGEYWTVASKLGGRSGFECVFTPLF